MRVFSSRWRILSVAPVGKVGVGTAVGAAIVLATAVALAAIFLGFGTGGPDDPLRCNGHASLCDRRVDQVAFAATHNAMSSEDHGYFDANQQHGIRAQLEQGVRGLLVDAYLGTESHGLVYTDYTPAQKRRFAARVGADVAAHAEELRRIAGPPPDTAKQATYLCHSSCELGATRADRAFASIAKFLRGHRSAVVIMVIEDYAQPERIQAALDRGRLDRFIFPVSATRPLPTLRDMVTSNRRLIVMLEKQPGTRLLASGYKDGLLQETPYAFPSPEALDAEGSCLPKRGTSAAPFFLINHFVTPPSIGASARANARKELEARVRRCSRIRNHFPSLVAVDFVDRGDLVAVIDRLNDSPPATRSVPD